MSCCAISSSYSAGQRRAAAAAAVSGPGCAVTVVDRDAAASYVLGRRTATGGFCFYRTPGWGVDEPNAPDTVAALESLRLLEHEPPNPEQTVRWLRSLQDQDGGYPTLPIGWAVLRSLQVLGSQPARSPHDWLAGLLGQILNGPAARDWRAVLHELLEMVELLPFVGVSLGQLQQRSLARLVARARTPGGGWTRDGAELESTASAVRVLRLLSLPLGDRSAVEQLLKACDDEALGLRIAPGAGATSAAALEAGLTLARALRIQPRYPHAIASSIALLQRSDGGLGARHRAISTLQDTWLGLRAEQLLHDLQEARR